MTTSDPNAVPVIDISDAVEHGKYADVASEIGDAARGIGFIQIVGHGIDPQRFHDVYRAAEPLWAMSDAELDGWLSSTDHPFRGVRYGLDPEGARIWQRLQNVRIETPEEAAALGYGDDVLDFFGGNAHPDVPGLSEAIAVCFAEGRRLGATLMRIFAVELGLGESGFEAFFDRDVSYFAVQDYPPMPRPAPGGQRLDEHSDSGALTMLHQRGDYAGLQLRRTSGEVVTVPMIDEAIVINVGDLMARWTNDSWLATPHMVADGEVGQGRTSIAMHYLPNVDATVKPLDTCVGEDGAAYEPVRMYEWNTRYFTKKNRVLRRADEQG